MLLLTSRMDTGGAETHILSLAKGLVKRGYFVMVASAGGVYEEQLQENGIPHLYAPLDSRLPHRILASLKIIKKAIKEYRFDILHAHARLPAFVMGLIPARGRFRKVSTVHLDFKVTPLTRKLSYWGEKALAVSEDLRGYLVREYDYSCDNIFLTVNGIDTDEFHPFEKNLGSNLDSENERKLESGETVEFSSQTEEKEKGALEKSASKTILHVSRMEKDRAYVAFLLAELAPTLYQTYGARVILVGGGALLEKLKAKAASVNAIYPGAVTVVGEAAYVMPYLEKADIFVGVSRAALEAMACGIPTVLSGNSGHMGVFEKAMLSKAAKTNFCCRDSIPASRGEMLHSLETLLKANEERLVALAKDALETVRLYYSQDRMVKDYTDLYESLKPYQKKKYNKTAILGYHGFGNLGDEAILAKLVSTLRVEDENRGITVISSDPRRTEGDLGVSAVSRRAFFSGVAAMLYADTLYVGGGTLLQNETSRRSLWYYSFLIRLAKWGGARVIYYANGIGPFRGNAQNCQPAVASLFKGDTVVSLRDEASFVKIQEVIAQFPLKKQPICLFSADPALLCTPCEESRLDEIKEAFSYKPYFVLSTNGCVRGRKGKGLEVLFIKGACLAVSRGYHPVILMMQPKKDSVPSKKLAKAIKQITGVDATLLAPSVGEAVGLVRDATFLLSARLHPLIFAASQNTPAVAVSEKEKLTSFAREIFGESSVVEPEDLSTGGDRLSYTLCRLLEDCREGGKLFSPDAEKVNAMKKRAMELPEKIKQASAELEERKAASREKKKDKKNKLRKLPPI